MDNSIPTPPPNLMTNNKQADAIVSLRKTQAKEILNTLATMSNQEADECKGMADALTQALRTYYQQAGVSQFNLNEALDALVTLTDRSQRTVHSEQQKKFTELSNRPTLALYMALQIIWSPAISKTKGFSLLCHPPGSRANPGPPRGAKESKKQLSSTQEETNSELTVPPNKRGNLNAMKVKKILQLLNL